MTCLPACGLGKLQGMAQVLGSLLLCGDLEEAPACGLGVPSSPAIVTIWGMNYGRSLSLSSSLYLFFVTAFQIEKGIFYF